MTDRRHVWIALALAFAVWLVFSWPLPLHVGYAIPDGSAKPPLNTAVQPPLPGDHLQLEYHFWLFGDMLAGRTPWFYNLYEFNTGNDQERREPGSFYFPFSLFHTVGSWIAGRAFGWNLSGFLALWLTAILTYRFVRRYVDAPAAAWLGAAAAIMLPYRWINLTGGSPTGFAMLWVPAVLLGIDIAVRDDKLRGGALAGIAILFAAWGDAHTLFFVILATPVWCLFAFFHKEAFGWKSWRSYARLAVALAPVLVFTALAYLSSKTTSQQIGAAKTGPRPMAEVALYSPGMEGLLSWGDHGISNHVFLGYALALVLAVGFLMALAKRRRILAWALLLAGMLGVVALALGPTGPFDGLAFRLARTLIPPYGMIRQPAKVYCLMPSLVALAAALAAAAFRRPRLAACLIGALLLVEWRFQVQPILSRMDKANGAYAAVARSPVATPARALVLPVWPGDSHYTSIYQHLASLYRIRLVNGYRPFVAQSYKDTIRGLDSANLGILTDAQVDDLLRRGVHHIILHEDLFPEKVSPFPAGFTLRNLMEHPRVEPVAQDGSVWAFQLLAQPRTNTPGPVYKHPLFPTRRVEWERQDLLGVGAVGDAAASDGGYVRLAPGTSVHIKKPITTTWAPELRWLIRLRGRGAVTFGSQSVSVDGDAWTWKPVAIDAFDGMRDVAAPVAGRDGSVDIDTALLVAGPFRGLEPGETLDLPAAAFFHAGRTVPETEAVALSPGVDRLGMVFYGPRLPFEPGRYHIVFDVVSEGADTTHVGTVLVNLEGAGELAQFHVSAGRRAEADVDVPANLPLVVVFVFDGTAACEIKTVSITRLAGN